MRVLFLVLLLANIVLALIAYVAPSRPSSVPKIELNAERIKVLDPAESLPPPASDVPAAEPQHSPRQ